MDSLAWIGNVIWSENDLLLDCLDRWIEHALGSFQIRKPFSVPSVLY